MRRIITSIFMLGIFGAALFAQSSQQVVSFETETITANSDIATRTDRAPINREIRPNVDRQANCGEDALAYGIFKLVGTTFSLWGTSASGQVSAGSQVFRVPAGASVSVSGFDFTARYLPSGTSAQVNLSAQIFNVNANDVPTGAALASITVPMDTGSFSQTLSATFAAPFTATQDFALVVENLSDSSVTLGTNFASGQDGRGEYLAGLRFGPNMSDWTNGDNIGIGGGLDFNVDFFFTPRVSYSYDADFVADQTCLLQGSAATFTSTSSAIASSQFFNLWVFDNVFNSVPDSTFGWDVNGDNNIDLYGSEVMPVTGPGSNSIDVTLDAFISGFTANGDCPDAETKNFTSGPQANALFISDSTAPKAYSFEGLPNFEQYIWDFGDGTTDNTSGFQATHTYATSDTFTVSLTTISCNTDSTTSQTFFVFPDFAANTVGSFFQQFNVYPNPATDLVQVEVEMNALENVEVSIYDMAGRVVLTQNAGVMQAGSVTVDMSRLRKGIYAVALKAGNEQVYRKVVLE